MSGEVKGAKELDIKLSELGRAVEDKLVRAAMREALKPVLDSARTSIPKSDKAHRTYKGRLVAPGFAARSLRRVVGKPQGGKIRAALGVAKEAFYALQFIEMGTIFIRPHPWLRPAFEAAKDRALEVLMKALYRKIEKVAKK